MQTWSLTLGRLSRWLNRWWPSESYMLVGAALLVGLLSGVGVWLFKQLIDIVHWVAFDGIEGLLAPLSLGLVAILPLLGGLVVGVTLRLFVGEERHHGVAGIIESVALAGGRLRYWRTPAKIIAAAVSIGSGASVGPEDPSVQIGANLGSMFGRWFRLSDERVRALVAAGAAGGIAAAFNAPIAGVFFALEIVLGEIGGGAFGIIVLASVVSAVFTQAIVGPQPAFRVPAYAFHSALEIPLYLGLGLLSGPIAAIYVRLLYVVSDFFHGWHIPRWLKPACAGLAVGVTGLVFPQIFGVGYETIEEILGGVSQDAWLLIALLLAKLILTSVSIGGGFPGGVFAPSLFLGATLGGAYGSACVLIFPNLGIDPPAFAMVGMAAVLAGAVHAPLTAIILLFEMTHDYRIILPLMFAVVISLFISRCLQPDSVYMLGLVRKGIRIERGRDVEVLDAIRVGEVMQTSFLTLRESDSPDSAIDTLFRLRMHGLPVVDQTGQLAGILTVSDVETAQVDGEEPKTVGEICTRDLLVAYPDETLGMALRRMSVRDVGRLPVVARDDPRHLLGILRRTDMIRAYDVALTRRATLRHRAQQVRLGMVGGVSVEEVTIEPGTSCIGQRMSEIPWPRDCVIATVRRGQRLIIPRGDTVLQAGDILAVVTEGESRQVVRGICEESRN
ncbi:MAG: chloride channel protein [Anaerolineae bacterium]|nr:chloride channel protein [Anaerolineae bacterium]